MEWRAKSSGSKLVEKGDAADTIGRARLPGHERADEPGRVALTLVQDHWLRRLRFHMPPSDDCQRATTTVVIGAERIELSTPCLKGRCSTTELHPRARL